MVVITHVYAPNSRTAQMIESFRRFGYEVAVLESDTHRGNGEAMRRLYECFKRAITGHETFLYADAGDSYCQRKFEVPNDTLIYSAEKNCYPHKEIEPQYKERSTPWMYLNGGGYGGSLALVIEFFEKYGLHQLPDEANGQHEQAVAYLKAVDEGFPIILDTTCELFQSMAFDGEPSCFEVEGPWVQKNTCDDFGIKTNFIVNLITGSVPAVLHFNGLTDMSILDEIKTEYQDED